MAEFIYYVSPEGSDGNPGTGECPFRTITAARNAARRCDGPVTVEVLGGIYRENLVFDGNDSGDTYLSRENAVITGGLGIPYGETQEIPEEIRVRLRPEAAARVRSINLKKYGVDTKSYGEIYAVGQYSTEKKYDGAACGVNMEVFENGRRMRLARYPHEGYLKLEEVADVGDVAEFPPQNYWRGWEEGRNHRGGLYIIDEETNERVKGWKNPEEAWMFGYFYWDWADSSTPVKFHTQNRSVSPRFVSRFGARRGAPYYFYNVLEELDKPGEFWIDRKNGILYVYPEGEGSLFEISAEEEPLIRLSNADGMTISGFTLTNVRNTAVEVRGNGNILRGLSIRNAAVHGITIEGYRNLAEGCEIAHTGCGGIYLTGGRREDLTPGENVAENNRIHDFSRVCRTYQAGVHLGGVGNRCRHNEIYGSPHLAVSYQGNEHVIEYNYIHDVVLHSGDAGAVYSGFDWAAHGTVIRYNIIENVGGGEFAPNGIYWDDGLSGQTAYGNILIHVKGRAFLAGGGRDNTIRDNLILGEGIAPIYYDDRNREGFFNGGWARASCALPDAPHWKKLEQIPYKSEIWRKKYPGLADISTDFSHPQDPAFPVNPANVVIENNVIINQEAAIGEIARSIYDYNEIGKNFLYTSAEEADFDRDTLRFLHPHENFPDIPVETIGVTGAWNRKTAQEHAPTGL